MTIPKIPKFSIDDMNAKPLAVIASVFVSLCVVLVYIIINMSKGNAQDFKDELSDCKDRNQRLITYIQVQDQVNDRQRAKIDSMELRAKLMLELSKKK